MDKRKYKLTYEYDTGGVYHYYAKIYDSNDVLKIVRGSDVSYAHAKNRAIQDLTVERESVVPPSEEIEI